MTVSPRFCFGIGLALATCVIAAAPNRGLHAQAGNLTLQQVQVIEAPRVFHEGADDKAGYWEDFGITEAFDFHPATQTLVAAIKAVNGPARLFIFDLTTGAIKFRPLISKDTRVEVKAVKLSPDGTIAAVPTGRGREITLWRVDTGTQFAQAKVDGEAEDVDWHPSGERLAVVAGKRVEIWNVKGAALELQMPRLRASREGREFPFTARWSPDGSYIAIGTNSPALYISAADGMKQSASLAPLPKGAVYMAEWNAAGTRLATAGFGIAGQIAIWDAPKQALESPFERKYALLHTFTPPASQEFRKLTWDPAGELVAFGDSQSNLGIWEAATGRQLATVVAHPKSKVIETHWKGDRIITVGAYPDKSFRIWSVTRQ